MIEKCYSKVLRRKFLEKQNLTLGDVCAIANAQEAVDRQVRVMNGISNSSVNIVRNRTKQPPKPKFKEGKECYACGKKGHFKGDQCCPARGKQCNKCGKIGHFYIKCCTPSQRNQHRLGQGSANLVREEKASSKDFSDSDFDYVYHIQPNKDKAYVTLNVGGINIANLLIDSGAATNIINKNTWEWLKKQRIQAKTRKSAKTLFAYGSDVPLPTLGTFTAKVICNVTNTNCVADFVTIDGDGQNLLGKQTAEMLNLLHVGPLSINSFDCDIVANYKNLFNDIGL